MAQTYCTFWLGDSLYGTVAGDVKEITALPPLTPIPQAPATVRGCVNLRGQIVLALDLHCLLSQTATVIGEETRLVVFRPHLGDPFGVLADRIGEIVELDEGRIERRAGGADRNAGDEELITGIGKLEGGLLSIIDARRLLPRIDAAIAQR